jgi:hypothetical protein
VTQIPVSELQWAIGIYTGVSPLQLAPPATIHNPVLARKDVSDAPAQFVADPFMVCHEGVWHMFFEVLNKDSDRGEIALAVSIDGVAWEYGRIVLAEPFHLSYPQVFWWKDEYYLLPESVQAGCVYLYRCTRFPTEWTRLDPILSVRCADPTIFRARDQFWMLACAPLSRSDTLRLYSSPDLFSSWHEHPCSPIVDRDARVARCAGRVISWDGRLIRYAQDCLTHYGERVRAFEILDLTASSYAELEIDEGPLAVPPAQGWNCHRMHHVDPHRHPTIEGQWIACVDGC